MKILNKNTSELSKFIQESLNTKAFNLLTFLESRQELNDIIGKAKTTKLYNIKPDADVKAIHDKVFGEGNQHIEIPINDPVPKEVKDHVESQGDSITESGNVKLKSGREVELSKYLPRSKAPKSVIDTHENWNRNRADPTTTKSKLVISRGKEVLSSTTRHTPFDSCADPEWKDDNDGSHGPAWEAMSHEIKRGTLIAMHVKHDAKPNKQGEYNSSDYLGRKLIKNFDDNSFHTEDKNYGKFPDVANNAVNQFTAKNYPMKGLTANKHPDVYNDDAVRRKENPNISDELINKLLHGNDYRNMFDAAQSPLVKPEQITDILHGNNDQLKSAIFNNPNINLSHLKIAAKDSDPEIRGIVARHHITSPEIISKLINDNDVDVRRYIARRKDLQPEHLDKLINDDDSFVHTKAVNHENVTRGILLNAANSNIPRVKTAARYNLDHGLHK